MKPKLSPEQKRVIDSVLKNVDWAKPCMAKSHAVILQMHRRPGRPLYGVERTEIVEYARDKGADAGVLYRTLRA